MCGKLTCKPLAVGVMFCFVFFVNSVMLSKRLKKRKEHKNSSYRNDKSNK